ncbi:MAG: hypothetical protein QXS38_01970 [Candidatus Pacearchaeota archaeon]
MKLMAINFFLFFMLIPLANSLDFTISYPEEVSINDSFSVIISAQTSDNYDVKIFVQDLSTSKIISEIYNEGWKNPFYYIKSAFPQKSEFPIRVISDANEPQLCARMRKTGFSSYSEKCGAIKIKKQGVSNNLNSKDSDGGEETSSDDKEKNSSVDFIPLIPKSPENKQETSSADDKIYLNPKKYSKEEFVTNDEKIRLIAVYSFTAFAIIIIILLAFKKL